MGSTPIQPLDFFCLFCYLLSLQVGILDPTVASRNLTITYRTVQIAHVIEPLLATHVLNIQSSASTIDKKTNIK